MIWHWLTKRRRKRLLAAPFPKEWREHLEVNVALYHQLSQPEQLRLQDDLRVFVDEKNWEGCGGLVVSDEMKVTIASQACLLLLGLEHDYFARVMSILIYPSTFQIRKTAENSHRIVVGGAEPRLGEAWYRGPVILAWDAVLDGSRNPHANSNLVLHEFAHQLDFLDGILNGTPPLRNREQYRKWQATMTREYERLQKSAESGADSFLDPYGATDPCEFFAVITEAFFTQPSNLKSLHADVYHLLTEYFRQDPAGRVNSDG